MRCGNRWTVADRSDRRLSRCHPAECRRSRKGTGSRGSTGGGRKGTGGGSAGSARAPAVAGVPANGRKGTGRGVPASQGHRQSRELAVARAPQSREWRGKGTGSRGSIGAGARRQLSARCRGGDRAGGAHTGGRHGDHESGDLHGDQGNRSAAGGSAAGRAGAGAARHPLYRHLRQRPAFLLRHLGAVAYHGRGSRDLRRRGRGRRRRHRLRRRRHGSRGVLLPLWGVRVLHHRPVQPLPAPPGCVPQYPRRLRRVHRRASPRGCSSCRPA